MYNASKNGLTKATQETVRLGKEINEKTNAIVNNLTNMYNETKNGLTKATQETVRLSRDNK